MTAVSQDMFRAALLDAAQPVPDGLIDGADQPAGRRYNVYRNNVAVSLTEALRTGFPVITRLLGQQNMDGLAGLYLRAHPPTSPLMMFYGESFPDFIATLPQLSHLGYLPDVARLELAMRRSYHAADSSPIDPAALGALEPEALMNTRFGLAPSLQLIRSPWPIHAIWRFNTEDGAPKPTATAQDVAVLRAEFDPTPHALPTGGGAFLDALMQGEPLGKAHEVALQNTPEFDPGPVLALLIQNGAITSLD
ncbi:DNA-binding domain-containing protein [Aestuariivita boseongensis]|uniref:HvfC/BufC N-terminal domain-containing protein n=1 Tax=Aestuariivita boseongensis TaxID=1470562 RepID=UPI0006804481|nr:DNA-binding domain-containing protein [Aestuariivita boseongensis]